MNKDDISKYEYIYFEKYETKTFEKYSLKRFEDLISLNTQKQ